MTQKATGYDPALIQIFSCFLANDLNIDLWIFATATGYEHVLVSFWINHKLWGSPPRIVRKGETPANPIFEEYIDYVCVAKFFGFYSIVVAAGDVGWCIQIWAELLKHGIFPTAGRGK